MKFFRAGRANLVDSFGENGGIVLINAYIPAFSSGTCRNGPAGPRTCTQLNFS